MELNVENNKIVINDMHYKLDSIIKNLTQLSSVQVYHFLTNRGTLLPRKINCMALMSVLNKKIKLLDSTSLTKDYFQRLQYYKYFTEQQLYLLFLKICNDEESFYSYRYNFFKLLLINYVGMNFTDTEITYLKDVKKGDIESFEQYFHNISSAGYEQENTFDGQNIDDLKVYLEKTASNQDVFDLARKYGIELPSKLRKDEYLEFILDYMKANNTYNDDIVEELSERTISKLSTFARSYGIPMQPSMSKQELITYFFYYLSKCEIEYTSLKRIVSTKEYLPLEFKIDLSSVNMFNDLEPKKVIYLVNDDNSLSYNSNEIQIIDELGQNNEASINNNEVEEIVLSDNEEVETEEIVSSNDEEVETEEIVLSDNEEVETEEIVLSDNEEVETEEIVLSDNEEVETEEIVSSNDEEVETEEIVLSENEEVETEETVLDDNEEADTEEIVLDDNEEVETEEIVSSNNEEVDTEETVLDDNEEAETEEIVLSDNEEVDTEEIVLDDNEEAETEETVLSDNEEVDTEETVLSNNEEVETEEIVLSDNEEVYTEETVLDDNEDSTIFQNLKKNELYGSNILFKYNRGKAGFIFLIIGIILVIFILAFCIFALLI